MIRHLAFVIDRVYGIPKDTRPKQPIRSAEAARSKSASRKPPMDRAKLLKLRPEEIVGVVVGFQIDTDSVFVYPFPERVTFEELDLSALNIELDEFWYPIDLCRPQKSH
jgi:hypothetical protein